MTTKRGLGKGLDSIIPEKMELEEKKLIKKENNNVPRETFIKTNEIEPNRNQPRRSFSEDSIIELTESIKQYGIIQPLILQKKDDFYEIIAGERRWRAAKMANLKEVPAIIKEYSDQQSMEIALIENIQREDLNPIEEAMAFQKLIEEYNLKQDEVAEKVSKSRVSVTNTMRLLKLDLKVQQMLIDDMISSGHARALLPIEDREKQYILATKVFDEKLSVRETEKLVKRILENKIDKVKEKIELDTIYKDLQEKIKNIIGSKVSINNKANNKGKIEIEYYSKEELDRIIELFLSINK